LFPWQVRAQIYEESANDKSTTKTRRGTAGTGVDLHTASSSAPSRPIAELYENTTILFADMAGFTAWSSTRQPVQVFELLETLYKAFDAIAVRFNVFKVETIGDCYVAVTGLPDPQPDHAVIMAKFASECMTKMNQLTAEQRWDQTRAILQ
jgi:class 3 adenylate cyclase